MQTPHTEVTAVREGRELFRAVLPPGEYLIGREGEVAILVPSEKVSRRHARLVLNYFDWLIEDLGSSNGTRVDGKKASERAMVFPSQEVCVGDVELWLRRLPPGAGDGPPAPQVEALNEFLPPELRGRGKFKVHGLIATGGMGTVLEAEDLATRRRVAMKVILGMNSAEEIARFIEEAQVTAQLDHPNIVPVYELNVNEQERPFYVMKLVRGESLMQALNSLRLERPAALAKYPLGELMVVFHKVCDAIAYAHSKGVVHRDLKPDNVMLGEFGEALVMDWGLAKPLGQSANFGSDARIRTMVSSLRQDSPEAIGTSEGTIIGTPQYMSPEQADGRSHVVDGRTDVYALGAILYAILTLRAPVEGEDAAEVMSKVIAGEITPPHDAVRGEKQHHLPGGKLPADLAAISMKALSRRPEDRHADVRELQAAMHATEFGGTPGGRATVLGELPRAQR